MLRINAVQDTARGGGYVEVPKVVGYFNVDETLPAFLPQRVALVVGCLVRTPNAVEAWVSHNGCGKISGFPISEGWEEECANPEAYFAPDGDPFQYDEPGDCDGNIPI